MSKKQVLTKPFIKKPRRYFELGDQIAKASGPELSKMIFLYVLMSNETLFDICSNQTMDDLKKSST
jgi:hypothetical protein